MMSRQHTTNEQYRSGFRPIVSAKGMDARPLLPINDLSFADQCRSHRWSAFSPLASAAGIGGGRFVFARSGDSHATVSLADGVREIPTIGRAKSLLTGSRNALVCPSTATCSTRAKRCGNGHANTPPLTPSSRAARWQSQGARGWAVSFAPVAQLVEQVLVKDWDAGSTPAWRIFTTTPIGARRLTAPRAFASRRRGERVMDRPLGGMVSPTRRDRFSTHGSAA